MKFIFCQSISRQNRKNILLLKHDIEKFGIQGSRYLLHVDSFVGPGVTLSGHFPFAHFIFLSTEYLYPKESALPGPFKFKNYHPVYRCAGPANNLLLKSFQTLKKALST